MYCKFRHFDTLIQTMRGLYIIFKIIRGLWKKILNHRPIKCNFPIMIFLVKCKASNVRRIYHMKSSLNIKTPIMFERFLMHSYSFIQTEAKSLANTYSKYSTCNAFKSTGKLERFAHLTLAKPRFWVLVLADFER